MLEGRGRVARAAVVVAAGLAAATTAGVLPAIAGTVTEYAHWTVSGNSGTLATPGGGLPDATFDSNSTTVRSPSGTSSFLGDDTPFGKEFGSSQRHNYLSFATAPGKKPSTTKITFDFPTDSTWGFALGDIDADKATITAEGANGKKLTATQLGWQGAFNYCQNSPRPSACTRPPFTDMPTWDPPTSTLSGHTTDTDGASGWFMPTKPVKSLTIVFDVLSGIPVGQLWIAAKWDNVKPVSLIALHAAPPSAPPGDTISYVITIRDPGKPDPQAELKDDLSDVLDDAHFNNDAHADGGTISIEKPYLYWDGPVNHGQTVTISYSVTIGKPPLGNWKLVNVVYGEGADENCKAGKGAGCSTVVHIRNLCRAVTGASVVLPVRATRDEC